MKWKNHLVYSMRCLKVYMKVSIGTNIKEGPWGGGNLFAINFSNYLIEKGYKVVNSLEDNDIDAILLTEPRRTSESSAFTHIDILKYQQFINKNVVVVHRINECDERKNTNFVNQYLIEANSAADATVFVSSWLKKLFIKNGIKNKNLNVILSGANGKIFNPKNKAKLKNGEKLKIVTHHWGANWYKGFDTYQELDGLLSKPEYKDKISFTYIGNIPKKFKFKNSKVIPPMSGKELADEIKKHHVYLTGSLNEPSGNHHIEAAQCGLPILFLDSGGMPEYCDDFGIKYNTHNFEEKLNDMIKNYKTCEKKMKSYPFNSEIMCSEYENLFLKLYSSKERLSKNRQSPTIINIFEKYIYLISRKLKYFWKTYKPAVFK